MKRNGAIVPSGHFAAAKVSLRKSVTYDCTSDRWKAERERERETLFPPRMGINTCRRPDFNLADVIAPGACD
jgi:hypothetical protein